MAQYEKVYVSIATTDGSEAAAAAAQAAAESICAQYGVKVNMGITRHSLLSADDAAVTCFDVNLPEGAAEEAFRTACTQAFAEGGADAGVCVLPILMEDSEDGLHEDIAAHADKRRVDKIKRDYEEMIRFGQQARLRPVTEDEARQSAGAFERVLLEDNGNGVKGMIGALAGVGLRLSGENGSFLGEYDMTSFSSRKFGAVAQCIGGFRGQYGIDPLFTDRSGGALDFHDRIRLLSGVEAVLSSGRFSIVCAYGDDELWTPYTHEDFIRTEERLRRSCDYFEVDPDKMEHFKGTRRRTCGSCLFRKLTDDGFDCLMGHDPVR